MWGKIIIPMYRLWLHGLYGLYGPRCPLSPKRPINLISLSLFLHWCRVLSLSHLMVWRSESGLAGCVLDWVMGWQCVDWWSVWGVAEALCGWVREWVFGWMCGGVSGGWMVVFLTEWWDDSVLAEMWSVWGVWKGRATLLGLPVRLHLWLECGPFFFNFIMYLFSTVLWSKFFSSHNVSLQHNIAIISAVLMCIMFHCYFGSLLCVFYHLVHNMAWSQVGI